MNFIRRFFDVEALVYVHNKLLFKFLDIKLWLITAIATPVFHVINKYLFADWQFIKWLCVLMALDLGTGILSAYLRGTLISSKGVRETVTKVIQYTVFLIVVHVLMHFEVDGRRITAFNWMDDAAYTFLMVVEAISILENLNSIRSKINFDWLINKLKQWK